VNAAANEARAIRPKNLHMYRLISVKTCCRFREVRIWNRFHFCIEQVDGASADHDAVSVLTGLFVSGGFIEQMLNALEIGTVLLRVRATAELPDRSSGWEALPPRLPRNGNRIENAQLPQLAVRIAFGLEGDRAMRTGVQFPAPGYEDIYRNEIIGTFYALLENLAAEYVSPRVLATGQTMVGACRKASGVYGPATTYSIRRVTIGRSSRRPK